MHAEKPTARGQARRDDTRPATCAISRQQATLTYRRRAYSPPELATNWTQVVVGIRYVTSAADAEEMVCAGILSAHPRRVVRVGNRGNCSDFKNWVNPAVTDKLAAQFRFRLANGAFLGFTDRGGNWRSRRGLHAARRTARETIGVIKMMFEIDLAPTAPGFNHCPKRTDGRDARACRGQPRHRVVHVCTLTNRQLSCRFKHDAQRSHGLRHSPAALLPL